MQRSVSGSFRQGFALETMTPRRNPMTMWGQRCTCSVSAPSLRRCIYRSSSRMQQLEFAYRSSPGDLWHQSQLPQMHAPREQVLSDGIALRLFVFSLTFICFFFFFLFLLCFPLSPPQWRLELPVRSTPWPLKCSRWGQGCDKHLMHWGLPCVVRVGIQELVYAGWHWDSFTSFSHIACTSGRALPGSSHQWIVWNRRPYLSPSYIAQQWLEDSGRMYAVRDRSFLHCSWEARDNFFRFQCSTRCLSICFQ